MRGERSQSVRMSPRPVGGSASRTWASARRYARGDVRAEDHRRDDRRRDRTPRFVGDVAVQDGVIVAVGEHVDGDATEVIDATGCIVAPGFVDIHTHYDGQMTWDPVLDPSASHGVTTVVVGNCGVGFAPVRPGGQARLVEIMEGVEDIPGTALHEGIKWDWETFPEYLDALDALEFSMDVAAFLPARAAARVRDG